jgi:hypothetical protein
MMEAKDWMSGLVGVIVFLLGLLPLLESLKVLKTNVSAILQTNWFSAAAPYLLAILGFYLAIESIIELTNSNHIGWTSFLIGGIVMLVGLLPVLQTFGIGPGLFGLTIPAIAYQIIFMVEGFFLMIAMFAMEL